MANKFAVAAGNWSATSTWADTPSGSAGASVPVAGDNAYSNGRAVTIDVSITCAKISNEAENGATVGGGFTIVASGLTVNANVYGGTATGTANSTLTIATTTTSATVAVNGTILPYNSYGIYFLPTFPCTLTVVGNVYGGLGSSGFGIYKAGDGSISITGLLSVRSGTASGTAYWVGPGLGADTVTGDVYGGGGGASSYGIVIGNTSTAGSSLTITGNLTGGYNGSSANAHALYHNSNNTTVTIVGNCTGGPYTQTSANGVYHQGGATISITGNATAGSGSAGATNVLGGTLKVIRATGNGFGLGSVGFLSAVGVASSSQSSVTYVEEIEYGALGQSPTSGTIILTDKTSNVALFYRPGLGKKTLIDSASVSGALPSAANVRFGIVYNSGNTTGTCRVPAASSVAYGVPVDATTGTAVLTPDAIWNALTSGMTTSGSIGERLKNASTVTSTGQQLSNALSS
jgi:hypothetical protein